MFEDNYRHMNDKIAPEPALVEDTLDKLRGAKPQPRRRPLRRAVAVCAAAACVLAATPALTAAVPGVYRTLYAVSPAAAQFFIPVQQSCEKNGIELAVDSARVQEDEVEIYVTLRDLTGNRIDETTDLWDSYSIGAAFGSAFGCEALGFDEATGTKTFRVIINDLEGRQFKRDKVTFSLHELVSGKHVAEDVKIPVDVTALPADPAMRLVDFRGGNYLGMRKGNHEGPAQFPALVPEGDPIPLVEDVAITAMGYAGGELHIQVRLGDHLADDSHGYFRLKAADGREWQTSMDTSCSSYFEREENGETVTYCEYIWKISRKELAEYSEIYGTFTTGGTHYEGPWRITFPVEAE